MGKDNRLTILLGLGIVGVGVYLILKERGIIPDGNGPPPDYKDPMLYIVHTDRKSVV